MRTNRQRLTVSSDFAIWLYSVMSGLFVSGVSVLIQWAIYDDWLHEAGPLRLAGSALAGLCMGALVFRSQLSKREKNREMVERLETIRWMNDGIRNSLQAIECLTYSGSGDPEATEHVKKAVDAIENILEDFLAGPDLQKALRTNSSQGPFAAVRGAIVDDSAVTGPRLQLFTAELCSRTFVVLSLRSVSDSTRRWNARFEMCQWRRETLAYMGSVKKYQPEQGNDFWCGRLKWNKSRASIASDYWSGVSAQWTT